MVNSARGAVIGAILGAILGVMLGGEDGKMEGWWLIL